MWDKAIRVCSTIMWIIFAWTMASLLMAVTALPSRFNPTGMIATMVLLTLGMISYTVFKKHRWIAAVLVTLAAVACIITAIDLHEAFPIGITSTGKDGGITGVDLAVKYLTATYVWPFMIAGWLFSRVKYKDETAETQVAYTSQFDSLADTADSQPAKRSKKSK